MLTKEEKQAVLDRAAKGKISWSRGENYGRGERW